MIPLIYFIDIPFITSNDEKIEKEEEMEDINNLEEELKAVKKKNLLYSILLDRYRDLIEEKEEKSISALKYLINPEDKFIRSKVEEIKKQFEEYSNKKAIQKTIEYIKTIESIRWPVSFWLSFEDVDKYKIGDDMDKCLILCSLLKALHIDSQILIDEDKHPYLLYNLDKDSFLIDCDKGEIDKGLKKDILVSKTFIYAFNDKEYEDLSEKEISL